MGSWECGENGLALQAPPQQPISLRPSNFVCACCQKLVEVLRKKSKGVTQAPPPWGPLATPVPVGIHPPHAKRPGCLALAATALLLLLPPHVQILQNTHPSPPVAEGPGGGLPAVLL